MKDLLSIRAPFDPVQDEYRRPRGDFLGSPILEQDLDQGMLISFSEDALRIMRVESTSQDQLMFSATNVVKEIRRSLLVQFSSYLVTAAVVAAALTYYSEYGNVFHYFFTYFLLAAIFSVIAVYAGKYVPTLSKHESLLNKYGRVYLAEAEKALGKHGMQRMLSTCWFDIYAGDFCDREITAHST